MRCKQLQMISTSEAKGKGCNGSVDTVGFIVSEPLRLGFVDVDVGAVPSWRNGGLSENAASHTF